MQDSLEDIAKAIGAHNLEVLKDLDLLRSRGPVIKVGRAGCYPFQMYGVNVVQTNHAKLWYLLNCTTAELEGYLHDLEFTWDFQPWDIWTLQGTVAVRRLELPFYDVVEYMESIGVVRHG